jgi:type 1 fimbriae regulatory protein FimB
MSVLKALNSQQIEKVLKLASESKRNHAMILLCFKHGLRASEVCKLKMSDVNVKKGKITTRRLKGSQTNEQTMYNEVGNPLLSELRVLKAWLTERESWEQESEYLFLSQKGGAMSRVQFFRVFQALCEQAGIPKDLRHPHALKHGLGVLLVKQGTQMQIIKQALGHTSLQSTAIYTSASDDMADKARREAFANQF